VALNSATNKIFVANEVSNTVTVIDGATTTTRSVAVGDGPLALAVNPRTNEVYVANYFAGTVTELDFSS
jgi:YVTN family beta-propeller protein